VSSAEEVLALMHRANNHRQVGETNMNQQSSRSHCIFTLKVQAKRKVGDGSVLEVSGKLHCVDLAGSECAKSADLDDDQQASRERERMNINRSLLTLGRVVSMLKDQSQGKNSKNLRIPYRDSKLTRILQESLGGRCKTCLIATVSPSVSAIEESISTLNYAQAANGIVNKPMISSLMATEASSGVMAALKNSSGEAGAIEHWHEMEVRLQYMQSQVEEAQQALARKHLQQQELMERVETAEAAQVAAVAELEEVQLEKQILAQEIEQHLSEKDALSNKLALVELTLNETLTILKATQKTEAKLTAEAQSLLAVLRKATEDGDAMHAKLLRSHQDDVARKRATKDFHAAMLALLNETNAGLLAIDHVSKSQNAVLRDSTLESVNCQHVHLQSNGRILEELSKSIDAAAKQLQRLVDDDIVTSVSGMGADVVSKCQSLQAVNSKHRTHLLDSSENLRAALTEAREMLSERETQYMTSSATTLEQLRQDMVQSDNILDQMMSSVLEAIAQGRGARKVSYNSLLAMVDKAKIASISSTRCIREASSIEDANVRALIEILENEASTHDEVARTLAGQTAFLGEQSVKHFFLLETQNNALELQRQAFKDSEQRARDMCQKVMANILSGVQDLVKSEMSSISEYQQSATATFVGTNQGLAESNQAIIDSFTKTFQQLDASTVSLQSHATQLRLKDEGTLKGLQSTCQSLRQIENNGSCLEESVQESSEFIKIHMAGADGSDQESCDILNSAITQQNKAFREQLYSTVFEKVVPRLDDLGKSVTELVAFAKEDVVDRTYEKVHREFEKPSVLTLESSDELVHEILKVSSRHELAVETVASTHRSVVNGLVKASSRCVAALSTGFVAQEASLDEYKASLLQNLEFHDTTMAQNIRKEGQRTSDAIESVDVFAQTVIEVDVEPPAVNDRTELTYSDELSSTPADHIILGGTTDNADLAAPAAQTKEVFGCDDEAVDVGRRERKAVLDSKLTLLSIPVFKEKTNTVPLTTDDPGTISKRRASASTRGSTAKRVRTVR
jgi:Kinesin motor domain